MMSSKDIVVASMVLLASLAISEGIILRSLGVELHCHCIETESRYILPRIKAVDIIDANSHCEETEIIATLKHTGDEVCLDPQAPWVKIMVKRIKRNTRH